MSRRILLLAGEESGVIYAERLADVLRGAGCEVRGYADYGFRTSDLAVMGFGPVLRRIFYFLGVARTMKRAICEWRPDVVATIDYPGMNLRIAAFAKARGIPSVHIVCPQVWAWRRGRIPKVAAALSKLLCFFPFEPALFEGTGLDAKFIGHPLVRVVESEISGASAAGVPSGTDGEALLAVLPGSRIGEIERILPRLIEAAKIVSQKFTGKRLRIAIPAANAGAERAIRKILASAANLPEVDVLEGGARDLLRKADCAAVASGTATLEAALAGCPTVLVYAVSPLLAWFARKVVTGVRHVGLANIIAEKCGIEPPMPELLQEAFTPEAVAEKILPWLESAEERKTAVSKLDAAMARLKTDGDPFEIAANEILDYIQ